MSSLEEDAAAAGVHPECWATAGRGGCDECRETIFHLLDERYDAVEPGDLRSAIATDKLRGRL